MLQNFTVTGMTCGHCEKAVQKALLQADPQAQIQIDRNANHVAVDSALPRQQLAEAISQQGYAVAETA